MNKTINPCTKRHIDALLNKLNYNNERTERLYTVISKEFSKSLDDPMFIHVLELSYLYLVEGKSAASIAQEKSVAKHLVTSRVNSLTERVRRCVIAYENDILFNETDVDKLKSIPVHRVGFTVRESNDLAKLGCSTVGDIYELIAKDGYGEWGSKVFLPHDKFRDNIELKLIEKLPQLFYVHSDLESKSGVNFAQIKKRVKSTDSVTELDNMLFRLLAASDGTGKVDSIKLKQTLIIKVLDSLGKVNEDLDEKETNKLVAALLKCGLL